MNQILQQHVIPVGTSVPQDFELRGDGAAIVGTGMTVDLSIERLVNGVAVAVENPPTVAWTTAASGTVRVSGVETLTVASYLVRFKVTDGVGEVTWFPDTEKAMLWRVVPISNR